MLQAMPKSICLFIATVAAAVPATGTVTPLRHSADPLVAAAFRGTANDCEGPRKPAVQRVDINKDGALDAIVWDKAECYDNTGGYFALVTRRGGRWVNIGYGTGRPHWLLSRSSGWPDFEARELHYGKPCFRAYQFSGTRYYPNYLRETEKRHCRNQAHNHSPAFRPVKPRR